MYDPKFEPRFMHESKATMRNYSQRNQVHWSYPSSWRPAVDGGTRLHRNYPNRVRHQRYPDILVPVETVDPT